MNDSEIGNIGYKILEFIPKEKHGEFIELWNKLIDYYIGKCDSLLKRLNKLEGSIT